MKKSVYLLLILVLASFTTSSNQIMISGKIANTENRVISIKGESFEQEIKLKDDGTFSENLTIEYDGIYTLETGKNSSSIYLSKGTKLMIFADDNAFNTSLKYTGKGSIENKYLVKKTNITSQISNEELYKLDENDFLKKIKEIKSTITALYNETKFTDINYKGKETTNIHYLEQKHLLFYKKYHNYYAGLNKFEVSEKFPKIDEKINLDNDSDFLFSNEYKEIVVVKFYENIKGDETSFFLSAKNAIPEIKALQSQSIKNHLIQNSLSDVNIENTNYEKIYNEFISITTDTKSKEILTVNYKNTRLLENGKPSPKFDYENHKGGKTSLESLKGKYVYIDVWATWCGPCRKEIPSLQKVEALYQGKNIVFVSISIDEINNRVKWSKLVTEEQLGGIQLLADKDWNSQFIKEYAIEGIPRFILIDPNGNIANSQAPKPSDTKLIDLFNSLQL